MSSANPADVLIVGAGNAGLCAALSARESGANVQVLEKAPWTERGGNTRFTAGIYRFPFNGIDDVRALVPDYSAAELLTVDVGRYTARDYAHDLDRLTEGLADPSLVEILVNDAYPTMKWMRERGVRRLLATGRQAFKVDGIYRFFGNLALEANGGGAGVSDSLFEIAEKAGITIAYETKATRLETDSHGAVVGVETLGPDGKRLVQCRSV